MVNDVSVDCAFGAWMVRKHGGCTSRARSGYRANVRSAIKHIRNKFRDVARTSDKIENYAGFGYCWKKPD
jgi:two-component system response regulator ChvI